MIYNTIIMSFNYVLCIILFISTCTCIYCHCHIEHFKEESEWKVIQTTPSIVDVPKKVHLNWLTYAKNYERFIIDDDECIKFLEEHYDIHHVIKFKNLTTGAHKADLFRYAWLYIHGGIYCDIKTVLIKNINKIFTDTTKCYMMYTDYEFANGERIYNGIIATPPKNPIMLALLKGAMSIQNTDDYLYNCRQGYQIVKRFCVNNEIRAGHNETLSNVPDIEFFIETPLAASECEYRLDRYGMCMFILDQDGYPLFKVRHSDYPWKNSGT